MCVEALHFEINLNGYKKKLAPALQQDFLKAPVTYIFTISSLHEGLIGNLIYKGDFEKSKVIATVSNFTVTDFVYVLITRAQLVFFYLLISKSQVWSGQVRSGQIRSGQVRSGQVRSGQYLLVSDLLLVTCSPVISVSWSGCRRPNWLPHQALLDEERVCGHPTGMRTRPVKGRMNSL